MNQFHQLAIELRYEGKTYEDISKALEGKLTVGTLKQYFTEGGLLDYEYHRYAEQQSKARRDLGLDLLKSQVKKAATVIVEALNKAVEEGDYTKAVKYAEIILNRVGTEFAGQDGAAQFQSEYEAEKQRVQKMSKDKLDEELRRHGIDPEAIKIRKSISTPSIAS